MPAKYITSKIDNNSYCLTNGQFTRHLREHGLSKRDYHVQYLNAYEKCPHCDQEKKFHDRSMSYLKTCGAKPCESAHYKKLYEDEDMRKMVSENSKKVWAERSEEVRKELSKKISQAHKNKSEEEIEATNKKRKKTILEKYGPPPPKNPKKTPQERHEAAKKTLMEKYGVDNPSKIPKTKEKIKKVFEEKYNGHPMYNDDIKEKAKKSYLKNYGVDHNMKQHLNLEFLDDDEQLIKTYKDEGIVGVCEQGNITQSAANRLLRQKGIDVIKRHTSAFEDEVFKFLKEIVDGDIKQSVWSVLSKGEVDIYIPDKLIAIECNGEFWHSEAWGKKDKNYHLNKTKECQENGIHLIHIWERDWKNNHDIVKNRLKSKLGVSDKVYARKCQIKELGTKEAADFLNEYHIQGSCPASVRYGLTLDGDIKVVMTFGKSRYDKDVDYELLRYCTDGCSVVGGASKMFSKFLKNHDDAETIVSYSDNMWNAGKLYEVLGFNKDSVSPPAPWYTKDFVSFESRIQNQKHKLEKKLESFDPTLTAWDNLINNGYDRVWDCGSTKWVYSVKK